MDTVFRKKENKEIFTSPKSSISDSDQELKIEILGQTGERSFEDRSVYLNIEGPTSVWLNGEKAIELGQMLINQGTFALQSNMVNHQRIHMSNKFQKFLSDNIVKYVHLKMVDDHPVNYGTGFCEFEIKPEFYKGKTPKYQKDFKYNDVLYLNEYQEKDFLNSLKNYGGSDKIIFHNYENEFWDNNLNITRMRENKLERIEKDS